MANQRGIRRILAPRIQQRLQPSRGPAQILDGSYL